MPVVVIMVMIAMIVLFSEQPGAEHVDAKSERCDGNCLIEGDRYWTDQAPDTFPRDHECDHCQYDRSREPRQIAKLAGSKGKAPIVRAAARKDICQGRDDKRCGVRRHVQAIRDERH